MKRNLLMFFLCCCILCSIPVFSEDIIQSKTEEIQGFTMNLLGEKGTDNVVVSGSVAKILQGGLIEISDVVARVRNTSDNEGDIIIHTTKAVYNRMMNIIDTDQFVRIDRKDMVVTGTGLRWDTEIARLKIFKNVRVEYMTGSENTVVESSMATTATEESAVEIKENKQDITVITSEGNGKMLYGGEEIVAIFKKNVEINDNNARLKSHLMKIFFYSNTKAINRVEAYGNVVIKQPSRESFSNKAVYFAVEDKIILSGNPRIYRGLDLYTAKLITIYDKGERVVFEPKAELIIYTTPIKNGF